MRNRRAHKDKGNHFAIAFPLLTIVAIGVIFVLSSFYEKSWSYNWDGISKQIKDSVQVAQYHGISSGWVGIAPQKPKQYDRRYWIMQNATVSELLELTEYPNGTIKTIAYEGLMRKPKWKNKTNYILKAIADNEYPIYFQAGCSGIEMTIGEYLIEFILLIDDESPPMPSGLKNPYGFSDVDIEKILVEYRKHPRLWK